MSKPYQQYTNYKNVEDFKRLSFIVDQVKTTKKTGKILDIGCGNGNISFALGSLGYDVLGVDVSVESIAIANQNNSFANVKFEVLDADNDTLDDNFDIIICSEVLEHLNFPQQLVATCFRKLAVDGLLIATVPNGFGPREFLVTRPVQWLVKKGMQKRIYQIKKMLGYSNATLQSSNPDLTHIQFFSAGSFRKMLQDSNFKNASWKNSDFIENVFPYSFFAKRVKFLQQLDCWVIDFLPRQFSSGFYTSWEKIK